MSTPIIAELRHLPQVTGFTRFLAIEMAHRASIYGVARMSYSMMVYKTGVSQRTVIRHVHKLVALGVIRKYRVPRPGRNWEWNTYTFLIKYQKEPPAHLGSDNLAQIHPVMEERGKNFSLRTEITQLKRGLSFQTPGTDRYEESQREIQRLRALLGDPP